MVKFVVCFKHPKENTKFENSYQDFLALVERMPNIQRRQVVHVLGAPQGKADYFRVLELYFADINTLQQTLLTPQGQEAGGELAKFDAGTVEIYYGDVYEE
jgi:uncharacterized protein (TIGR02118 family)